MRYWILQGLYWPNMCSSQPVYKEKQRAIDVHTNVLNVTVLEEDDDMLLRLTVQVWSHRLKAATVKLIPFMSYLRLLGSAYAQ